MFGANFHEYEQSQQAAIFVLINVSRTFSYDFLSFQKLNFLLSLESQSEAKAKVRIEVSKSRR